MKLNAKKRVLAGQRDQLALSIQIHAIASTNSVSLFAELDSHEAIGAPRNELIDVHLVVVETCVSFAQRMSQVDLRMNTQMSRPELGCLAETVQLVARPSQVVVVRR